ncbi:MAG TPA: FGGY-family carbohydrate kinase, partial [Bacillota bacterium]|nr:FGGY-family carbohydrate kinase [Bacillota bacterium]
MGLDIGTTGCKCTIFSIDGRMESMSYQEYRTINPEPGQYELDPAEVWEAVCKVIKEAISNHTGEKVTALSVSSLGEAAVPVDKDGNILHNSLLYIDTRGESQARKLEEALGIPKIMEITGLPAHPMYTINKVMWFKKERPDIYRDVWKFMLYGDYILYKLGGVPAIDYSLASRTMAFNVVSKTWDPTMLGAAGIDKDIFSPAYPAGTAVGQIKKDVASELGLSSDLTLVVGAHDHICASIGAGVFQEGMAIDSIGTVECITPAFNKGVDRVAMLANNFAYVPHAVDGTYSTYAFSFTGGSLLKWYRDNFGAMAEQEAAQKGISVYALLDAQAAQDPTGILVLPHFAGTGTPYMDSAAKGAIIGLDYKVDSGTFYRALLEGVTYEMQLNMEALSTAGIAIQELRCVGGGAKSEFWMQIKADIFGKKVVTLETGEAGTLGAAVLAGAGTGRYKSLDETVQFMVKKR